MNIGETLRAAIAARAADKEKSDEAFRLVKDFADGPTKLFVVYNSKLNHYFVMARDKKDALTLLERAGHVVNRKLARIKVADDRDWIPEMKKFFAAAAQASSKHAQGIVTNMNGFAVMKNGRQVYMPISVVKE